jgi:hypothetical protein
MLNAMSPTEKAFYESLLSITNEETLNTTLQGLPQDQRDTFVELKYFTKAEVETYRQGLSEAEREKFDLYRTRFRYMDDCEIAECADFLNSITGASSAQGFDTLRTVALDGSKTYQYVYVTKLVLVLSQRVDTSYCKSGDLTKYNTDKTLYGDDKLKDTVTVTYTFSQGTDGQNRITADYSYKYMTKLNTSEFTDADSNVITRKLNYATNGTTVVPGCEAQVDAENDSIKLNLYFSENSMSYTDKGMVKLRNSYVLHDAK